MATTSSAAQFTKQLKALSSMEELQKVQRYFKSGEGQYGEGDKFIGVRMGDVFKLAKQSYEMPIIQIEKLLESPIHEVRAGAVSIMDQQARQKKVSDERLQELYDLYIRRLDRINNWDLVDLGSLYMVGRYLYDRSRKPLYKLAKSKDIWARRTAIVGTTYFIRQNDLDDTFAISEILLKDKEDLVHKATGWMLRFAGDKDRERLLEFLDDHAATMPRTLLRASIEKLTKADRVYYMKLS